MAQYNRQPNRLNLRGINITQPSDRLGLEWAQVLRNLRIYRIGELRQRPGLAFIADADAGASAALNFERRINDFNAGTFRRIIGTADGNLYVDNPAHSAFTLIDSGYSGDPLSGFIARPDRSPDPYLFVGDTDRQAKISKTGDRTEWGLSAPLVPPVAELLQIGYNTIQTCTSSGGFVGVGGAVTNPNRYAAIAITDILFDSGATGWASVQPASLDENFQEGSFITFSGGPETVIIESIYPAFTSTTIAAINYDSGTSGPCVIQLTTPTTGLQRNSLVRLNSTESARVLSVTLGLDGIPSFRCSTVGTFSAGQTVEGLRTFRAYCASNHTIVETLSLGYVQIAVAAAGISTLSKVETHDLTLTTAGAGGRPLQEDDYIHISINVSDFTAVTEIQFQFDCDSTTNDFTQNYFFKSIRQPDLLAAYEQTATSLTAQQQRIQRQQIDQFTRQSLEAERQRLQAQLERGFGTVAAVGVFIRQRIDEINRILSTGFLTGSGQGALSDPGSGGANQWSEFKIPFREFERVGADTSRGWKDTKAFQISINATAAVNIGLSSLWAGGSYGPDFSAGQTTSPSKSTNPDGGYEYCYRMRNSLTGGRSNPSPPTRYTILAEREAVALTIPAGYTDPQADVADYFRRGGTDGAWHFLATVPSNSTAFTDDLPDDTVITQIPLEIDRFKPWPRPGLPASGTVSVIGTTVLSTGGDSFDTAWIRGNQILINRKAYSFYTNPSSTTRLELNESAGFGTGLTWEMPEPTSDGMPLQIVFGPYSGAGSGEFSFGLGDPLNPGYLYFTNGNDPESASDVNIIELCGPSEKLVAGGILDGIIYVFSDRRSWRILPSFNGGQTGAGGLFYAQETAMGKGLASRWGLTFGDQIYFLSWDGVYASKGDAVISITDEALSPLFHRDGSPVSFGTYNGINGLSFDAVDEKYLSLTYSRDGVYMTERDIIGQQVTWYYGFLSQGWVIDSYTPTSSRIFREAGGTVDILLMGSIDGGLYQFDINQSQDVTTPIECRFLSREENWNDFRAQKQLGDIAFDIDPGVSNVVSAEARLDQNLFTVALGAFDISGRTIQLKDLDLGEGRLARSIAVNITWSTTFFGVSYLYGWEPSALIKPEATFLRFTDWDDGGYLGPKFVQGFRLHADTFAQDFDLMIETDDQTLAPYLFTVNFNGEGRKDFAFPAPVIAHMLRITPLEDTQQWRFFDVEWIYEPEPPLTLFWQSQFTSLDLPEYFHIRDFLVAHRSTSDITVRITVDGATPQLYTIPHSSGERAKEYLTSIAAKGKLRSFQADSGQPFSLYLRDMSFRAKAWGSVGPYETYRPFGDRTRDIGGGARI